MGEVKRSMDCTEGGGVEVMSMLTVSCRLGWKWSGGNPEVADTGYYRSSSVLTVVDVDRIDKVVGSSLSYVLSTYR